MKTIFILGLVFVLAIPYTWIISRWMYRKGRGNYLKDVFYLNRYKEPDPFVCVDRENYCECANKRSE